MLGQWLRNVLVSIDQMINALLGGDPDETISSRAGKAIATRSMQQAGIWHVLCRMLHWIDPNHCPDSIEHDEGKDQIGRRR